MKIHIISITLLLAFFLFSGCDSEPQVHTNSGSKLNVATVPGESSPKAVAPMKSQTKTVPNTHQCLLEGAVLEDNNYWIRPAQTLVGITATDKTKDPDFGDSHRIFTAVDTRDCSLILEETLPINRSPDFPWYLNTNTYESKNQVLCMQGIEFVYCYDVPSKKMLAQLKPTFLNKRIAEDAQSGTPAGLDIWGQYLLGYALDLGASVFDLSDKNNVKTVLPNAEYYSENEQSHHSLFLLADEKGMTQAFIPTLNEDQDGMIANNIFKKPKALSATINANVRDNRYIVLASKDGKSKTAIDMEKMIAIELPSAVAAKNAKAILDWLKK